MANNAGVTITLAEPEARALEGFCRRQLRWDAHLAARVKTSSGAIGVFTAPPLGVLAFMAVPTAGPTGDDVDITVRLQSLADELRGAPSDPVSLGGLPRAITAATPGASLTHLPPSDGWQLPMFAVAGDLSPKVDEATAEFEARSAGHGAREQELIAEEIWGRAAFAGLPMRALHAARQLGMLGSDMSRVSAATSGPWKRFSTSRGQVFVYASGPAARLSLHVVR